MPTRARRWRPRPRQHASACSRASGRTGTPPPSPNPQHPTPPPIGHPAARALTAPRTHRRHQERALRSRPCMHAFLTRNTQAWRRNYIATPPLPCTLEPSPALAVTRFHCMLTEPDRFATGTVSHSRSLVHHWTETTTPSPARRPNPPIIFVEVHPRPRPSRADKAPAPPLLAHSARHLLPLPSLSPLGDPQLQPTLAPLLLSLCKLAGRFTEAEEEGRRLPSHATPLASLLSLSGFPDSLRC
jgi:hypothetical protein